MRNGFPSPGGASRRRVLLVDDDDVTLEVLSAMLSVDGHDTYLASNREAALERLASTGPEAIPPDALFLDLRMPGLSSQDFLKSVRALAGPKLSLVAMSATPAKPTELSGFHGFLLKPPTLEDLRDVLARVTNPARLRPAEVARTRAGAKRKRGSVESKSGPPSGARDVLDRAVLGKLGQAMSHESLLALLRVCVEDSRARLAGLSQLAEAGRFEEVRRGAHQIKGAAAMIGASRLAHLASSLELGSYNKEDTKLRIAELLAACGALERMLLQDNLLQD